MVNEDTLTAYLNNQIALGPLKTKQYVADAQGQRLPRRFAFNRLDRYVSDFLQRSSEERIVIMPGLRGTGKTTLLFQVYDKYQQSPLDSSHILYLSCDEIKLKFDSTLSETLGVWETRVLRKSLEELQEKYLLLIDESHYDEQWRTAVKNIYDRTKNIFIFVTGSSSVALEITADLSRRASVERIYPLNFLEFLIFKNRANISYELPAQFRKSIFSSATATDAYKMLQEFEKEVVANVFLKVPNITTQYEEFLLCGGFPFTLSIPEYERRYLKIISTIEKIIDSDLLESAILPPAQLAKVFPMLQIIAQATDNLSYDSFTASIKYLNRANVLSILDGLGKSGLLTTLTIKADSQKKVIRHSRKYCYASASIRAAILWQIGVLKPQTDIMGRLLETDAFSIIRKVKEETHIIHGIFYDWECQNVDYLVDLSVGTIPIEIGWGKKDTSQVLISMRRHGSPYGILVADTQLKLDGSVISIPKILFSCL